MLPGNGATKPPSRRNDCAFRTEIKKKYRHNHRNRTPIDTNDCPERHRLGAVSLPLVLDDAENYKK